MRTVAKIVGHTFWSEETCEMSGWTDEAPDLPGWNIGFLCVL